MSNFIIPTSYVSSNDDGDDSKINLAILADNLCSSVKPIQH